MVRWDGCRGLGHGWHGLLGWEYWWNDRPHPDPLPQERGKWFLRLDEFGDDGFAVAVVEPEARRYIKICKKGRIPLIPTFPGIPIVPVTA